MNSDLEIKLEELRNIIHSSVFYKQAVWDKKNKGNWNKLWSAFDNIRDSQDAILEYQNLKKIEKLANYGLLQALIVQQDAVRHLEEAIGIVPFNPCDDSDLKEIRTVRIEAIGHPTETKKKWGKALYENGEISYTSMGIKCGSQIEYFIWTKDGARKRNIDLMEIIKKQGEVLNQEMNRIRNKIMDDENKHVEKFKGNNLEKGLAQSAYLIQKLWPLEKERYYSESCFKELVSLYEEFKQGIRERYKIEKLNEQGIQVPGLIDVIQKVDKLIPRVGKMLPMEEGSDQLDLEVYIEALDNSFKEIKSMAKEVDEKFEC